MTAAEDYFSGYRTASRWVMLIWVVFVLAPASASAYSVQCSQSGIGCISQYGYNGQSVWGYPVDGAGNNCTNYAAFRLSRNGADNPGNLGHAGDWAANARAKGFAVNGTPTVGSIAQWNYGSSYAPSSGHVAYVEEVTSSDIALSDSNFGGGSKRWRVSPGDTQWPSNFLHIRDVAGGGGHAPARIGALMNDDAYLVKDGPLNALWTNVGGGMTAVTMSGDRIGALQGNGAYLVKEGPLNAQWTTVAGGVRAITMSGTRVGALMGDGAYLVKDGPLNAQWTTVAGGVKAITMPDAQTGVAPPSCSNGQTGTPPNCVTPAPPGDGGQQPTALSGPPSMPAAAGSSGTTTNLRRPSTSSTATRIVQRTIKLVRGCSPGLLRVSGSGVKVVAAKRLRGSRCRVTLRVRCRPRSAGAATCLSSAASGRQR